MMKFILILFHGVNKSFSCLCSLRTSRFLDGSSTRFTALSVAFVHCRERFRERFSILAYAVKWYTVAVEMFIFLVLMLNDKLEPSTVFLLHPL
ncbi:hypothetical protein ASC93_10905 [Massilia sp. Root335]|nr:hypothetical protein ASC93_10905 [Massilia sp. Root335]